MCWCLLYLVLGINPPAPVLDYGVLPPGNTVPGYRLTTTIELGGQPPVQVDVKIGTAADPEDVADSLGNALVSPPWVMERDGLRVTLWSRGKARVTNVTVTGDGPKPAVRWAFAPPKK